MSGEPIGPDDVGRHFVDGDGRFWRVIAYCDSPTAEMELVGDEQKRRWGSVSAPIFAGFHRMMIEGSHR